VPVPPARTVLDTDFAAGTHFSAQVREWLDQSSNGLLHYVGVMDSPRLTVSTQQLLQNHRGILEPGFHRFHLHGGRISLTVCVAALDTVLGELRMQADAIILPSCTAGWTPRTWKQLAKQCRRNTMLQPHGAVLAHQHDALREAGFTAPDGPGGAWRFNPRWQLKRLTATDTRAAVPEEGHCAVIGAGLAGSAVAYALALRGWKVTVVERNERAATGASGLPAGLAVPHVSGDDNARSRLSRAGIALLHQHARHLLTAGEDWAASGALTLKPGSGVWHPQACWVRPAKLVGAWLNHPNIRVLCAGTARSLEFVDGQWQVRDTGGRCIVQTGQVVLANAGAVRELVLPPPFKPVDFSRLTDLRGVVSSGYWPPEAPMDDRPTFPVNGDGSFIPGIPGPDGAQWHCGATFESGSESADEIGRAVAANQARLSRLLPETSRRLDAQWLSPPLGAWCGVRCTTHDRLPLVGALTSNLGDTPSGLWCSIGMGSRGLSFAALCAEQLAAEMNQEPWPIEARLRKSLNVGRSRRLIPS